jgi:hypothetical protein
MARLTVTDQLWTSPHIRALAAREVPRKDLNRDGQARQRAVALVVTKLADPEARKAMDESLRRQASAFLRQVNDTRAQAGEPPVLREAQRALKSDAQAKFARINNAAERASTLATTPHRGAFARAAGKALEAGRSLAVGTSLSAAVIGASYYLAKPQEANALPHAEVLLGSGKVVKCNFVDPVFHSPFEPPAPAGDRARLHAFHCAAEAYGYRDRAAWNVAEAASAATLYDEGRLSIDEMRTLGLQHDYNAAAQALAEKAPAQAEGSRAQPSRVFDARALFHALNAAAWRDERHGVPAQAH